MYSIIVFHKHLPTKKKKKIVNKPYRLTRFYLFCVGWAYPNSTVLSVLKGSKTAWRDLTGEACIQIDHRLLQGDLGEVDICVPHSPNW